MANKLFKVAVDPELSRKVGLPPQSTPMSPMSFERAVIRRYTKPHQQMVQPLKIAGDRGPLSRCPIRGSRVGLPITCQPATFYNIAKI